MSRQFNRTAKIVTGIHVGIVFVLFFHSGIMRLIEPKPEVMVPIEFVVDTTPPMPDVSELLPPEPEPEPEILPPPVPQAIPEPAPTPKPKRKIEKGRRIKRNNAPESPPKKKLSAEEIQKLLDMGAKPSDHTSIPDEDTRCLAIIRDVLHSAWQQPSAEAAGDSIAVLRIKLGRDGSVRSSDLQKPSGNPALDSSVRDVGNAVKRIHGLTSGFIGRHPSVTVSFTVD